VYEYKLCALFYYSIFAVLWLNESTTTIIFHTQILELKLNKAIGIMSVFGGNFRTVCHRLDIDVYTYTQDRTFDPGHLLPPTKKTTIA